MEEIDPKNLPVVKCIIVGDEAVGKTELLERHVYIK